ncbi:MAG: tol-pal system protein YbgF [Geminicoccaceae bacterium]
MTSSERTSPRRPGQGLSGLPDQPRRRLVSVATGAALFLTLVSASAKADIATFGGASSGGPVFGAPAFSADVEHLQTGPLNRPGVLLVQTQRNDRAREQAIIWRLEEEIRRLNGRIEELEFEQRQTNNRLDQLILEIDQQRLTADSSDVRDGGAGPVFVEQTARSPEDAIKELAEQASDISSVDDGTLGSVPETAVANLPRPDPADIAVPEDSGASAEQQYEKAVKLLQAGDYKGAQNGLEVFLDVHDEHQLASNAAYWLAETHYVRQNYAAAAANFARNYRTYGKESPKAVDNLLKLGMSLSNLGENDKACLSYDELTTTFPSVPANIQQALNRERARAKCS